MYKKKSFNVIIAGIATLCLVIVIALVYAGFTGQLNIKSGNVVGRKSNWDIHFENVSNITTTGTAKVLNNHEPTINSNNPNQIDDYDVSLTSPNDSISFTFDIVNGGNYNAKITSIDIDTPECSSTDQASATNMCNNLTYTLTDINGASISVNDVVYAKDKISLKVTLTFNDISDASLLPTEDVSISNLGIEIDFEQEGNALVKDNGEVANYRVYKQGDKITLNNEDYWVIENSGAGQDYVVALKDQPLTVAEVNLYGGAGTENNHVNGYTKNNPGTASNLYNCPNCGGMAYYSSETCGYINGSYIETGCTTDYDQSDIKFTIDSWATSKFTNNELKSINSYEARLLQYNDLEKFGYYYNSGRICNNQNIPDFLNVSYRSWTMEQSLNTNNKVIQINNVWSYPSIYTDDYYYVGTVRPVINVYKSALES